MARLGTLTKDISPPPLRKTSTTEAPTLEPRRPSDRNGHEPSLAAVEAGQIEIRDHLNYFVKHLSAASRTTTDCPRLDLDDFRNLYERNQHQNGRHFVVHQHDHPVAGTHYDLRLQFSASSTISFAVPYGLPGNPNSLRPNRFAVETRVHNLWNNLIESASHVTGSLLVWETGEYEVLPEIEKQDAMTDDESSEVDSGQTEDVLSESDKLAQAFQSRHIRLRLHGARLPENYTVSLRLPSGNDRSAHAKKPTRKRRRVGQTKAYKIAEQLTDSDSDETAAKVESANVQGSSEDTSDNGISAALASEDEEDATIRANNAYPGATNTIGSIHQRHWFLTLDRPSSGFRRARSGSDAGKWIGPWEQFFVLGRDHERSVVTGRTSDDVLADEGAERFVGRKMWRPIME